MSAHAVSAALFQKVMESAGERLSILRRAGKIAHIERLLEEAACTDAALALADIEMPNWKIRRLVFENDERRCSLSRQPSVLIEFDAMAEANHAVLSLAILRALIEARRINRAEPISVLPLWRFVGFEHAVLLRQLRLSVGCPPVRNAFMPPL